MKSENLMIPLNGLRAGKTVFSWRIGKEFFAGFDNSDILGAELSVEAIVHKTGSELGIDCRIEGAVTVSCDRCLENLEIPIKAQAGISVDFSGSPQCKICPGDDKEVIHVSGGDSEVDLSQIVYDYSVLSLPMRKAHPAGKCNPDVLKYLASESVMSDGKPLSEASGGNVSSSPFAALKDILKKD